MNINLSGIIYIMQVVLLINIESRVNNGITLGAACNSGKKNSPLGVGGKTSYYNHGDCRTFRH